MPAVLSMKKPTIANNISALLVNNILSDFSCPMLLMLYTSLCSVLLLWRKPVSIYPTLTAHRHHPPIESLVRDGFNNRGNTSPGGQGREDGRGDEGDQAVSSTEISGSGSGGIGEADCGTQAATYNIGHRVRAETMARADTPLFGREVAAAGLGEAVEKKGAMLVLAEEIEQPNATLDTKGEVARAPLANGSGWTLTAYKASSGS